MIINRLNINKFGKFNNMDISLSGGLNVIYGKNESGKTTLLDFIVFMLYGSDKRQRDDLSKYKPRDGSNMYGFMDYTIGDGLFTAERSDASQTSLRVKNAATGNDVIINNSLGADIFGFGVEAFKKTYYSGSVTSVISDDKQGTIADRISHLSKQSMGEATYSQIKKHLTAKINSYISRRCENPVIPTLEQALHPAQKAVDNAYLRYNAAKEQKAQIPDLKNKLKEYEQKISDINLIREQQEKLRLNSQYESLLNKISNLEAVLNSNRIDIFKSVTQKELELFGTNGENLLNTLLLSKTKHNASFKISACVSALFFAVSAVLFGMFFKKAVNIYMPLTFICCSLVFLLCSLVFKKLANKSTIEHEKLIRKTAQFLGDADISSAKEFTKLYFEWVNKGSPNRELLQKELESLRNNFDDLVNNINTKYELSEIIHLDKNAISYDNINSGVYDDGVLNQTLRSAERLKLEIELYEDINPDMYFAQYKKAKAEADLIKKQLATANMELKVYTKALELTERANAELESMFAPRVSHFASEVFGRLTGARYDTITINSKLDINVKDNLNFYNSSGFSTATREQMYLALRLAVTELSSGEKLPVFLDDCLSYYDDERKKLCFEFLKDFSKDRQIIFLTCHKAELDLASELGANIIKLSD